MKHLVVLFAVRGTLVPAQGRAQVRGKALYDLILQGGLTRTEGTTYLTWLPDGSGYLEREDLPSGEGSVFHRVDPATGKRKVLFDDRDTRRIVAEYNRVTGAAVTGLPFGAFSYEQEGSAIRFAVEDDVFLYDLHARSLRTLNRPRDIPPFVSERPSGQFSPDFNAYVFVRDYDNLFVMDTRTGQERPLAQGSSEDHLAALVGVGPWFVWSPDSRMVAYVTADDDVLFKGPRVNALEIKPEIDWGRYPFAEDPDPTLALFVVDVASGRRTQIVSTTEEFPYLRDIVWLPDASEVTFKLVHRWQNRADLMASNPQTAETRTILVEREETYLDPPDNFRLLADGRQFLWSSERSGWRHIYLYDIKGKLLRQLTNGEWETGTISLVDEANRWIYFDGYEHYGADQFFYRVRLDGSDLQRLTPDDGMHSVSIDPAGAYFVDDYSSMTTPRTVNLHRSDGRQLRTLATTTTDQVDALSLTPPELFTVKAADGMTDMQAALFKPADFDPRREYEGQHVFGGQNAVHSLKVIVGYFVEHLKPLDWERSLKALWQVALRGEASRPVSVP